VSVTDDLHLVQTVLLKSPPRLGRLVMAAIAAVVVAGALALALLPSGSHSHSVSGRVGARPGGALAGGTPGVASTAAAPRVMRAPGAGAYLADGSGRWLFLRGVAVTGLIQYASDYHENPPLTPADGAEIAALGFDYIRLPISWSMLEPAPGRFSTAYLSQIARTVAAAQASGLDVVVDLHNDRYNRMLAPGNEADGAPDWATLTSSGIAVGSGRSWPGDPAACVAAIGSARCIQSAWQSFWSDRPVDGVGLQRYYLGALLTVSRQLRSFSNVLGFELMNNPSPGAVVSPGFERLSLYPFWVRAIAALRADGEHRPLWLDDASSSEETGADPGPLGRFSSDGQLVFAPHDYVGVFAPPAWPTGGAGSLVSWYRTAEREAATFDMAPVDGEWGTGTGTRSDQWIQDQLALQERFRLGSAFWMWKQLPGFYNWSVVQPNGTLRSDSLRAQLLSQPHPDATPGVLESVSYAGQRLVVRVRTGGGGQAVLWSGTQVLRGGRSLLSRPLTMVQIDGRRVPATLTPRRYPGGAELLGYLVSVVVPPGTHTITLSAPPR
jgi:Cellulase (glycosyl hydrolase family 5)